MFPHQHFPRLFDIFPLTPFHKIDLRFYFILPQISLEAYLCGHFGKGWLFSEHGYAASVFSHVDVELVAGDMAFEPFC